jgi:hypothetical protein
MYPYTCKLELKPNKDYTDGKHCQMSLYKKNLPVKGPCGRCFICLRAPPLLRPPYTLYTPPLHPVYGYTVYLFTHGRGGGGRANQREG